MSINNLQVIEGRAYSVRHAHRMLPPFLFSYVQTEYECSLRLSGLAALLQLRQPIFIEDGDQIKVVGSYNKDGVIEVDGYSNKTAEVTTIRRVGVFDERYAGWIMTYCLLLITLFVIL